jgi:hypothetical protein
MGTNGNLDSDASGNMMDQKMYRSMLEAYSMWLHQGRMWCLVYACVLDFKPHQKKVIWRQPREYWGT